MRQGSRWSARCSGSVTIGARRLWRPRRRRRVHGGDRGGRPGARRSGSAPIPPTPTAPASAAARWRSTATSSRASLNEQLRALDRVCRAAGTTIDVGQGARSALRGGGQGRRHLRDVPRRRARQLRARTPRWCCRRAAAPWRWCCATAWRPARRASATGPTGPTAGWSSRGAARRRADRPGGGGRAGAQPGPRRGGGRRRRVLTLWVDTLCIHGDSPGAVAIADRGPPGHGGRGDRRGRAARVHDARPSPSGRCGPSVTAPS